MTQKDTLAMLLLKHRRVTLQMGFDNGIGYTMRNRVCDLKREGWQIVHYNHDPLKGETVSDNAYILQSAPRKEEADGQQCFL